VCAAKRRHAGRACYCGAALWPPQPSSRRWLRQPCIGLRRWHSRTLRVLSKRRRRQPPPRRSRPRPRTFCSKNKQRRFRLHRFASIRSRRLNHCRYLISALRQRPSIKSPSSHFTSNRFQPRTIDKEIQMNLRFATVLISVALLHSVPSFGQTPTPPTAPAAPRQPSRATPPPPPPAPPNPAAAPVADLEAGGQPVNIRLDVSVTDQSGAGPAQPKTLTVLLADRAMSRTRSSYEDRTIDVDARASLVGSRIRVTLTIASNGMRLPGAPVTAAQFINDWRNSFTLLLDNGKSETALESSDAAKNRKTSVDVKATIQK
jgi:hypothetical protein